MAKPGRVIFRIEIDCSDEALSSNLRGELADILGGLVNKIDNGRDLNRNLLDSNRNVVGRTNIEREYRD